MQIRKSDAKEQADVRVPAMARVAGRAAAATAIALAILGAAPASAVPGIGRKVAPFVFRDLQGRRHTAPCLRRGKATVFVFLSTQCPVSKRYGSRLVDLAHAYGPRGVQWFAVNANRDESRAEVARDASQRGFPF